MRKEFVIAININYYNSYLGFDLGEKTLGIALSETGIIAQKLKTLIFKNHQYQQLIQPLTEIISHYKTRTIVLGYPKHMNNDIGIKAKISIAFKKELENNFPQIKVILWDERLSTVQSLKILKENNKSKAQIKEMKDAVAATIILQNYLNFKEMGHV